MEKHHTPWIRIWHEQLTTAEKKQLLATFLQQEAAWKASLETAFREDVQQQRQYLAPERSAALLTRLHAQILHDEQVPAGKARVVRLPHIGKWAAAAAVVAIAGLALYWFRPPATASTATLAETPASTGRLHTVVNNAKTDSLVRLTDGSVVTLASGSSIRYYEPYKDERRDINLLGQAVFKVAKDTARPFTVYAGGIATTALGTQFLVTTLEKNRVAVRLYEGKVAIHQVAGGPSRKAVVLQPGEEFSLDQVLHQFSVKPFKQIPIPISEPMSAEKKPVKERNAIRALEFAQEPLPLVLTAIEKRYHVQFIYDEAALHSEAVTGKFLSSDSLSTVLSILETVNKLTFTRQNGSIVVVKSKQ